MGYRIKTVAAAVGVPRNTLLAWERRYGLVVPRRTANGYREYSDADIELLKRLKVLVDQGHAVSEAVTLLDVVAAGPKGEPVLAAVAEKLLEALLRVDRHAAEQTCRRIVGVAETTQVDELYFPLLRRVGDGWAAGELSVAQEHYASQFVRERLHELLNRLEGGPRHGPHALCASFPDELHDLALLGLAIHLAAAGHRVSMLGAAVPLPDLVAMVADEQPQLVAVSVLIPRPADEVAAFARALRSACATGTRVVMGGAGLPSPAPEVAGVAFSRDRSALPL